MEISDEEKRNFIDSFFQENPGKQYYELLTENNERYYDGLWVNSECDIHKIVCFANQLRYLNWMILPEGKNLKVGRKLSDL